VNQKGIPLEASFSPDSQFVFSGMYATCALYVAVSTGLVSSSHVFVSVTHFVYMVKLVIQFTH